MKKIVLCLFLFASIASAQDTEVQLAQAKLEIAQLKMQLHDAQTQVELYKKFLGVTDQQQADAKAVKEAEQALVKAEQDAKPKSGK